MMPVYAVVVRVKGSGPIEGAEVIIDGALVGFTDATGSLTIPDVTTGSHTIEARKEGYSPDSDTVSVPETTSVTLTLTRLVYTITVHVEGSGPIAGASMYFDGAYVGLTDSAGGITITDVAAGSHTIRAEKSGYSPDEKTISVPETMSVILTLTPIAKIRTEVRISSDKTSYTVGETAHITQGLYDDAGNLISGRTVDYTVTRDGAWYAGWGQYSDDPSRDLILSEVGTYVITGNFPGDGTYEASSNAITITAITPVFEVTLDGYVRDSSTSKPIQGAKVNVWVDSGVATSYTDSSGHYGPFGGLPEGGVTLTASARGYVDYSKTITLVKGSNRKDIALAPGPEYTCGYCGARFYTQAELDAHIATVHARITIGVKVTEEDGTPIAGAGVQVGGVGGVWDTGSDGIAWISGYLKGTTGSIRVATLDGRSAYDAHKFTYDREVFTITVPPAPIEITARARVKWPDGTPIPNVRIHFDTVDVRTDYLGRASFRIIKDKPYWVNMDNPRGWTETFYAMVWAYNNQEIGFTLRWTY